MNHIRMVLMPVYLIALYSLNLIILSLGFVWGAGMVINHSLILSLLAILLCTPLYARYLSVDVKILLKALLYAVGIYILLFFATQCIYDVTTDGQTYHLQTALNVANGWNPAKGTLPENGANNIFIQHYAKAYEYGVYSIYSLTGKAEGAKLFNVILIISSAFLMLYTADFYRQRFNLKKIHLLVFLAAFNPISVFEVFSFYVDGEIASCIIILLSAILLYRFDKKNAELILFFTTVLLINLKFTGLVYAAMVLFLGFLVVLSVEKKRLWHYMIITGMSVLVAVLLVGYNPYVRNTVSYGHPFYPLMGPNKVNIMGGVNAPLSFEKKSIFRKVTEANLARSRNIHGLSYCPEPEIKMPFTFKVNEWTVFKSHDVRMGGFGPLWSGVLVLYLISLAILGKEFGRHKKQVVYFISITGFVLCTVFINPEGWYARYVPQFWLLPLCASFFLFQLPSARASWLANAILVVMTVNLAGTAVVSMASDVILSQEVRAEMKWLKQNNLAPYVLFNTYNSNKLRMDTYDIPYKELNNDTDTVALVPAYKSMKIQNSSTTVFYPSTIPAYQAGGLFSMLSKYINASKHGE